MSPTRDHRSAQVAVLALLVVLAGAEPVRAQPVAPLAGVPPVVTHPAAPPPANPRQTIVGLPQPQFTPSGELIVRPNVQPAGGAGTGTFGAVMPAQWDGAALPALTPAEGAAAPQPEMLPAPGSETGSWMGELLRGEPQDLWLAGEPLVNWDEMASLWHERQTSPTGEAGLGRERVATAPFVIDISQPLGNFRFRTDAVYNLTKPDRSEFFWSKPPRGPVLDRGVDYQDFRFLLETGSDVFSLGTEVPIRLLNPDINDNTGGISDIQLVQKMVMMNGHRWQMTQLMRTVFNSGNARKGLGTGHVQIEPGMLFRYRYSDLTYFHSEIRMTIPIAADPMYAGPALRWGLGMSTVYYETDTFALIPTLEFTNIWLLDGQFTPLQTGLPVDVRGDGIFNLSPGLRMACDTGGDLGIVELGWAADLAIGSDGWYDGLLRFDLRFVF